MPSFFDYLRKRVYDAILLGAHEAFEHLESNLDGDFPKVLENGTPSKKPASNHVPKNSHTASKEKPQHDDKSDLLDFVQEGTVPPPRKRGRPRGKRNRS